VFAKDIQLTITLAVRFANDQRLAKRPVSIFALEKRGTHTGVPAFKCRIVDP